MRYLLLLLSCAVAGRAAEPPEYRALKSYEFDASAPLPRMRPIPPWLLRMWEDADERKYRAYAPTRSERKIVTRAFARLPAPMTKVLAERLIGVYFVAGLKGNGITDWVLDSSSRPYVYIILNPAGFRQTVSEVMTERDLTLFRGKADLRVEAGAENGISYAVAHEAAHAFDTVRPVTPYAHEALYLALNPAPPGAFGWDVWEKYSQPKSEADYPLREKLHFYGFGAPELEPAQAVELCSQWAGAPFASFYGGRSWAEDFAELFVLRHLTQDLGLPLRRICAGKAYAPWDNPRARRRAQSLLEPLYR